MKSEVFERVMKLEDRHGPREHGKVCQKLLALAFRRAGYLHIVERGVQGVDVDAATPDGKRYAVEVKTVRSAHVTFGRKDAEGLCRRQTDGYTPLLAVLRLEPFSSWYFVKAGGLAPGRHLLESLRARRLRSLESLVEPLFDEVLLEHFEGALGGGQGYMDSVLRGSGVDLEEVS